MISQHEGPALAGRRFLFLQGLSTPLFFQLGQRLRAAGAAVERINNSDLDELVVTDTIPLREDAKNSRKIRQLSVAGLLAETILRIFNEDSVSSLFIE